VQQIFAVLFVLLALLGAVAFLRKKGFAVSSASLGVRRREALIDQIDRMRLGPQHSIHLLRVDDRKLLIALHPHGVTVLRDGNEECGTAKGCR
jgi:flagellar biogenesis protein FliO